MLAFLIRLFSKIFFFTGRVANKNAFLKPLKPQEEREYFLKLKSGDKDAEEILIKHNLRLVAHIVKKYSLAYNDKDELISVGGVGLMKAVRSYDFEKGNSFSTYASRCIQNEILMLLRSQKKRAGEISLEESIGSDKDGNDIMLSDIIADSGESVEERAERKVIASKVIDYIRGNLSEREQEILFLRYGLSGGTPLTQNEVAHLLGISRSYISRLEKKCIEDLKNGLRDAF